MPFNIIEDPKTKQLHLATGLTHISPRTRQKHTTLIDFGGESHSVPVAETEAYRIVAKAPCASEWRKNPGNYKTLNAVMDISYQDGSEHVQFKIGENLAYLNNWIRDTRKNHPTLETANLRAYSCRNVARNLACLA